MLEGDVVTLLIFLSCTILSYYHSHHLGSVWRRMRVIAFWWSIGVSIYWAVQIYPVFLVLSGAYGTGILFIKSIRSIGVDQGSRIDSAGNRTTYFYITTNSWWSKTFLELTTGRPVSRLASPAPHQENKEWNRRLYRQFQPQSSLGRFDDDSDEVRHERNTPDDKLKTLLRPDDYDTVSAAITEMVSKFKTVFDSMSTTSDKVEEDPVPSYTPLSTSEIHSSLKPQDFADSLHLYLGEKQSVVPQAGTITFSSLAGSSVMRVVSARDGKYEGWASCFKVGDKLVTVAHAHGHETKVELGYPMLDDLGSPLKVEVPTSEGMRYFDLTPLYRSDGNNRDMVICCIPPHLQSSIPGLKCRVLDLETDTEVSIIGFPVGKTRQEFSTSRVKDRTHMAGSLAGMSGSPLIGQGRVALGVHEGVMSGGQVKQFHPFTQRDIKALKMTYNDHIGSITPPSSPAPEYYYGAKKKGKRGDRLPGDYHTDNPWDEDDGEMDFDVDPFAGWDQGQDNGRTEQRAHPAPKQVPKRPATPTVVREKVKSQKARGPDFAQLFEELRAEQKAALAQMASLVQQNAIAAHPPSPPKGKKKAKTAKPKICMNLQTHGMCSDINRCPYDHKLAPQKDFHQAPPKGAGAPISSGSTA
jgi:hypothetical protein